MPTELATNRIELRFFEEADSAFLIHHAQDPDIVRWATRSLPPDEESATEWIGRVNEAADAREAFWFAIVEKTSGAIIGAINLRDINLRTKVGKVGFWLAGAYRRQGFALEALQLMLRFAFDDLKLHVVIAAVHEPNTGSSILLQKAGFRLEGRSREAELVNGLRCDVLWYGILRTEFCRP